MYRFYKINTLYPRFAEQVEAWYAERRDWTYETFHQRVTQYHFFASDYYSRHLRALGNECLEVFLNCGPLQRLWAREHGVDAAGDDWQRAVVLAQVRAFRPHAVFLHDLYNVNAPFRAALREAAGPGALLLGWRSAHMDDFHNFRDLDLVLTAFHHYVDAFRNAGVACEYLPLAFEPAVLDDVPPPAERDLPLTFLGSIRENAYPYVHRYAIVNAMLRSSPLCFWGDTDDAMRLAACGRGWERAVRGARKVLRQVDKLTGPGRPARGEAAGLALQRAVVRRRAGRMHEPVFGRAYYELLGRSRVTLNGHIDCAIQCASNMRLYEATGMAACLLTEAQPNLPDLFEPDREVVTYAGAEECAEKARYLLDHDRERRAIADAGQRRTLRDHTYADRVARVDAWIRAGLKQRPTR